MACRACWAVLVWVWGAGWVLVVGGWVVSWALWVGELEGPPCIPPPMVLVGVWGVGRSVPEAANRDMPHRCRGIWEGLRSAMGMGEPPSQGAWCWGLGGARARARRCAFAAGSPRFQGSFLGPVWAPNLGAGFGASGCLFLVASGADSGANSRARSGGQK